MLVRLDHQKSCALSESMPKLPNRSDPIACASRGNQHGLDCRHADTDATSPSGNDGAPRMSGGAFGTQAD